LVIPAALENCTSLASNVANSVLTKLGHNDTQVTPNGLSSEILFKNFVEVRKTSSLGKAIQEG